MYMPPAYPHVIACGFSIMSFLHYIFIGLLVLDASPVPVSTTTKYSAPLSYVQYTQLCNPQRACSENHTVSSASSLVPLTVPT